MTELLDSGFLTQETSSKFARLIDLTSSASLCTKRETGANLSHPHIFLSGRVLGENRTCSPERTGTRTTKQQQNGALMFSDKKNVTLDEF